MNWTRTRVLGPVAALVLIAAACGNNSSGGSGGSGGEEGEIVFGAVFPETGASTAIPWGEGVRAAEAYINETLGGVDGRKVRVIYCDDQGQDPAKNSTCVRNFVAQDVTAVLAFSGVYGASGLTVADTAGIASISSGSNASEQTSDSWIGLHADYTGGFAASLLHAKEHGAQSVSLFILDIPDLISGFEAAVQEAAEAAGVDFVQTVTEAGDAADFTPGVLKAAQGADVVILGYAPPTIAQIVKAGEASGIELQYAVTNTAINVEQLVKPAGTAAEGLLAYSGVLNSDDESEPQVKAYRDAMAKQGSEDLIGGSSQIGFSYLMTAYEVLKELPDYEASTFLDYFKANPVPVFMGQTYDATNVPFPDRPGIHVTAARVMQVQDGAFVEVSGGEWLDAFAPSN